MQYSSKMFRWTLVFGTLFSFGMTGIVRADSEKETELIKLLQSDAPKADKALACKKLAVHGSSAAVPELAKLLSDPELASWCRIALEAIPGAEANEALRSSLSTLDGLLLMGAINSIGVKADADSVDALTERLTNPDAAVASAAAVALGRIGTPVAAKTLRKLLSTAPEDVQSAVAEGCILCAERALQDGKTPEAIVLYDAVRQAEVPKQRIREATRGAILARGQEGIPLLVEQLNSADKTMFQMGLSTAREFPGTELDAVLATEMARAVPVRAALILQAMADRPETVVLSAVLKAAESGPQEVRLVAIAALGRVGDASCLSSLLKIGVEEDEAIQKTAKQALSELPGESIDQEIVKRVDSASGKIYPLLLDLIGERRIAALPPLLKALNDPDKVVRTVALTSLGNTVPEDKLSVLIAPVVSSKYPEDAPVAELALKTAAIRMPDREACASELSSAFEKAPKETKNVLLEIIGAVGGTKALETVASAANNADPMLQDTSSKLLGSWMTPDAAPVLLELAMSDNRYKVRAQRGYFRIARQMAMEDSERMAMCRNAYEIAQQPAEQKVVLELYRVKPHLETLKLAVKALAEFPEDLMMDATQTVLSIVQKLGNQQSEVGTLLAEAKLRPVKLEIVKAEYGAGTRQKDVTETLKMLAGDLQWIKLPMANFTEVFGEDPAPGEAKQLKVQYRVNEKPGEVSITENSWVILPMPK